MLVGRVGACQGMEGAGHGKVNLPTRKSPIPNCEVVTTPKAFAETMSSQGLSLLSCGVAVGPFISFDSCHSNIPFVQTFNLRAANPACSDLGLGAGFSSRIL